MERICSVVLRICSVVLVLTSYLFLSFILIGLHIAPAIMLVNVLFHDRVGLQKKLRDWILKQPRELYKDPPKPILLIKKAYRFRADFLVVHTLAGL